MVNEDHEPADTSAAVDSLNGKILATDEIPTVHEALAPVKSLKVDTAKDKETTTSKSKGQMSTKPAATSKGDPPTPLVKKIINSGTFGTGSVKPASLRASVSGTIVIPKPAPSAPSLKKAVSSAPAPPAARPAVTSSTTNRRTSIVPTAKSGVIPTPKPSLSASVNGKLGQDNQAIRAAVVSPTGSTASTKAASGNRPRASVSEAVKKAPLLSRPNATTTKPITSSKPPPSSRLAGTPTLTKPTKPTGSISSIREVKEDGKAVVELQNDLREMADTLQSKTDAVVALEAQVEALRSTLQTAHAEVELKSSITSELEDAKNTFQAQLENVQIKLKDQQEVNELLQTELANANTTSLQQRELVDKLNARVETLEAQIASAHADLETLQASHLTAASDTEKSVQTERVAFLKVQSELQALVEATQSLKAEHQIELQNAQNSITELESRVAQLTRLEAQVTALNLEKEENAGKVSELEVEVLELKEAQDELEDNRERLQAKLRAVEENLANSSATIKLATEEAASKEAEHLSQLNELKTSHEEQLKLASMKHEEVVASLGSLQSKLEAALSAQELAAKELLAAQDSHSSHTKEIEEARVLQKAQLSEEMEVIKRELEGQEATYQSKLEDAKRQHENLLQEAFERAKKEAGEAHGQELQTLREGSNATIEQIQKANQISLENLKAEHASVLESEVKDLIKQVNTLTLDLKATQDDLSKAKSALETSCSEVEILTTQIEEARTAAELSPPISPEAASEIARLTQELVVAKDDLAAATDMLGLTKASLTEMSDNHGKELEEAAKSRAEEVIKLRAGHDAEVASLATQKSDLLIRLSDLEGELATTRATLDAEEPAPKSNGNGASHAQTSGVTKEELQRMHEAHNLKIYDLEAQHEKALKTIREELEARHAKVDELQLEVDRKTMEIQYLEQEQDESQEQVTRLNEDIETMKEKIAKLGAGPE